MVQDSIDVIDKIGCDQNGHTRQNHDNGQPDCQHPHHRRKCTPPGLSFVKRANLECKSQENYESVRDTPSDRVRASICTSLFSDLYGPVQRGCAWYSLRNFPSTDPNSTEWFTRVNAGGIGMDHFQAEVFALDFPRHLSPLFAVHLVPVVLRWAAACPLAFLQLLEFHVNLPRVNSTRLGPVGDPLHSLSIGVGPLFFSERRRHHLHNRQYRSHAPLSGRNAPDKYAALAAEPCCA